MQILKVSPLYKNYHKQTPTGINTPPVQDEIKQTQTFAYSKIPFTAIYNITPKKINISIEQNKLFKQISDLLDKNVEELDFEDFIMSNISSALNQFRRKLSKLKELSDQLNELESMTSFNAHQQLSTLNRLHKEFKQIEKSKIKLPKLPEKPTDEKTDFQLINKFKSALTRDDYRFLKIYQEHYQNLNRIQTLEELSKTYPKIKIPPRPEEVIAQKITKVLTRDFYQELDELIVEGDSEKVVNYLQEAIINFTDNIAEKYHFNKENLYYRLAIQTNSTILEAYKRLKSTHGFAAIPSKRKSPYPDITPLDAKLLTVNFQDFVLSVIKKQYLEGKKLNEIIYDNGNIKIPAQSLNITEYKFDKPSDKIKHFITMAENIDRARRNYPHFTIEDFKTRLNFFASTNIGNNDEILERIIAFDSCRFEPEDIEQLIKFLSELDNIYYENHTIKQGLEIIKKNNISPHGTKKLDELEQQKAIKKYKQEQEELAKLNLLRDKFDNMINLLYLNNLNTVANTCSKYSPKTLDHLEVRNANYLINTISKHISADGTIENKKVLDTIISRWDTFNYYQTHNPNDEVLQKALSLARQADGSIDIDKAGQYILNSEIINHYPESRTFARNAEILDHIMEKTTDFETAIKYLSKFDDYFNMKTSEQSKLNNILSIFNLKDSIDKSILKYIIENDYSNVDTKVLTRINEKGSETIETAISANAKQQILAKYKFPICLEYMKGFEEALSSFASARGASGIKKTGSNNNALEYKMELKLKGHDDRLFSSQNNYIFDIYSSKGLH